MHFEIPYAELKFPEEVYLGAGGFGEVLLGTWKGTEVAVKKLWKADAPSKEDLEALKTEVAILAALRHPNVVLYLGYTPKPLCMLTEYMPMGSLRKVLNDDKVALPWGRRIQMITDVAKAMAYLHSKNIIHRDLKSQNLLVSEDLHLKVCDFGISRVFNNKAANRMSTKGNDLIHSPEILEGKPYNESADVFSFGLVLWELITREYIDEVPRTGLIHVNHQALATHPSIPEDTPKMLKALMCDCLQSTPAERPTFEAIIDRVNQSLKAQMLAQIQGVATMQLLVPAARSRANSTRSTQSEGEAASTQSGGQGKDGKLTPSTAFDNLHFSSSSYDVDIDDEQGAEYWTQSFGPLCPMVEQKRYLETFPCYTGCSEETATAIWPLLMDAECECMTQASLYTFITWFRPLKETAPTAALEVIQAKWFWPIGLEDAHDVLKAAEPGVFVVCFNALARKSHFYIAAVVEGGVIENTQIERFGRGFTINNRNFFPSLGALVYACRALLKVPASK